jgi:hypothetical protein
MASRPVTPTPAPLQLAQGDHPPEWQHAASADKHRELEGEALVDQAGFDMAVSKHDDVLHRAPPGELGQIGEAEPVVEHPAGETSLQRSLTAPS